MKPALNHDLAPETPQGWQQFGQGEALAAQLEARFNRWWPQIFGYHLLKVGALSCQIDTSACSIKHQIHLADQAPLASVIADPDDLPFIEHAVDAVLLTHTLEYTQDPHHVIREAHRVLMPDGYLLLSGFNPISVCGLLKLWPGLQQSLPWTGRFFSIARVKDWLALLGFEILSEQRFFCRTMLPIPKDANEPAATAQPTSALQHWVEQNLRFLGASYIIVARKRTLPLTPIKPRWQRQPQFNRAVKGVSARSGPC
jgi:SAM-dependent methyltransferase